MQREQSVYKQILNRLVNGAYPLGARLRSKPLAEEYNCSPSTIREILFRLSADGLLNFYEQRGFHTPKQSRQTQHDLTEFRILLECEGACRSTKRGGIEWEARLAAAHYKLSHIEAKVKDGEKSEAILEIWTAAEREFHRTLIDSCGSKCLKDTHDRIYNQFRQQLIIFDRAFVFVEENIAQHENILKAALAHDKNLLCERIKEHLGRHLIDQ